MTQKQQKIDPDYYDKSGYYDRRTTDLSHLKSAFQRYRISKVLELYTPKKHEIVLDLGCGFGTFSFTLSKLCKKVTGIDFSKRSIEICNKQKRRRKMKNVEFIRANAIDTGLPSETYDTIICADLVEHLYPEDFRKVIQECTRVLRSKGKLVIWTPHNGHFLEILRKKNIILKEFKSHVDYKSMDTITQSLISNKFVLLKKYYAESHLPVLGTFEKLFMGVIPIFRRRIAVLAVKR